MSKINENTAQEIAVECYRFERIKDSLLILRGLGFCIASDEARLQHDNELSVIKVNADRIEYVIDQLLNKLALNEPQETPESATMLSLAEVEKQHILRVLEACNNVKTQAAKILGIERSTLDRKLKLYKSEQSESETK